MKLSPIFGIIVLLFREAVVVGAADCVNLALSVIPSCAQNCFLNGAPSVGCAGVDFNCQCEQEARLYAIAEDCVSTACPSASYQAVIDGGSSGEEYSTHGWPYLQSSNPLNSMQLCNRRIWRRHCRFHVRIGDGSSRDNTSS